MQQSIYNLIKMWATPSSSFALCRARVGLYVNLEINTSLGRQQCLGSNEVLSPTRNFTQSSYMLQYWAVLRRSAGLLMGEVSHL